MLPASRSRVWRASTSRDAGSTSEITTPTAAPMTVSRPRRQPELPGLDATAESTTSPLIGTCRARWQPQQQLGDAERHRDEQRHGEAVQIQRIADGQREEHAEHHRRAPLECRADRGSDRDLHHHDGRERAEHRIRDVGDRPRDPPRQPGCQPGLGHRPDLGRRRGGPRHRVAQALPQPGVSTARTVGRSGIHGQALLTPSGYDGSGRSGPPVPGHRRDRRFPGLVRR